MANVSFAEQLEQAVQALLADRAAKLPPVDASIAPLISIASELSDLPRADFRARLKNELERSAAMATEARQAKAQTDETSTVSPVREGFRTVTPYIAVKQAREVIDFVQEVFGAQGKIYGMGSEGGIHSEYQIGDSMLMIGGGEAFSRTPQPAALHLYVEDVDAVYERALAAGATSLHAPMDQEYGERSAAFLDAGGNHWYPATYQGEHYIPEGAQNLMAYLHPRGAVKQVAFLKEAFGAEEVQRHESPEGIIYHAKVRIGNSIVEMGEAHEQWQPMPGMFMLYVDDVDSWYARAVR